MGRNGRATLADIARLAKVDSSTVSLVLNRKPLAERLSAETRERVFAAARELNYQPSFAARTLKTGRSGAFGMVVGDLRDPYYSMLAYHMIAAAQARGYQVLTCATGWDPQKEVELLRMLYDRNVDGVFYVPGSLKRDPALYETLRDQRFPLITYCTDESDFATAEIDYSKGFRLAVADLAGRHRRIGHISSVSTCYRNLQESVKTACRLAGVELIERRFEGIGLPECVKEIADYVRASDISAFIVNGSVTAVRLINRLEQFGLRVPRDLEIVGVGDLEVLSLCRPALSCINYDTAALMEQAVELLIRYRESDPGQVALVPSGYIARNSTRSTLENPI